MLYISDINLVLGLGMTMPPESRTVPGYDSSNDPLCALRGLRLRSHSSYGWLALFPDSWDAPSWLLVARPGSRSSSQRNAATSSSCSTRTARGHQRGRLPGLSVPAPDYRCSGNRLLAGDVVV